MLQIAVVLAVYKPQRQFLAEQLASLARQSHTNFRTLGVVADELSAPLVASLAQEVGLEIEIEDPGRSLGAVAAFEHGLKTALTLFPDAAHFALCDQDDIWFEDRLSHGQARLLATGAALAHSDAKIIDADGKTLAPSMFAAERRALSPSLSDLLRRNTVTGMTAVMTRACVDQALPFPKQADTHFYHDLWLALVAQATDGVATISSPLVAYRQHGNNAVGLDAPAFRTPDAAGFKTKFRALAGQYGLARYLANALETRLGPLPALRAYRSGRGLGAGHVFQAMRAGLRGDAVSAKLALGHGVMGLGRAAWILRRTMQQGLRQSAQDFDTRLFGLSPGVSPAHAFDLPSADPAAPSGQGQVKTTQPWWTYFDARTRPGWAPKFSASRPRCTVLVPSLNPQEIFAGIATALDVALGLAERGVPVRLIATDLPIASALATRAFLAGRNQVAMDPERVELACGVLSTEIPCHGKDFFLATAWWTAHVADTLIATHSFEQHRFIYLIQDYEPGFYPWGDEYAGALASYDLAYDPLINTTLLADHLAAQGHTVQDPLVFHPSINIDRYNRLSRPSRQGLRHVALYGRPEVARNMFHTSIEGLGRFVEANDLRPDTVEISSVGMAHEDVLLPNGVVVRSRGKLSWDDYPHFLATVDVGLALMLSPHPSHLPLEMAAAGARVVTNAFGPKALDQLTPAILSARPEPRAVANTLQRAWHAAPPSPADRAFSLEPLGLPLEDAVARLAVRLKARLQPQSHIKAA